MIYPQQQKQQGFGQQFVANILQKLPYVQNTLDVDNLNVKYDLFKAVSQRNEQRVLRSSVITGPAYKQQERFYNHCNFGNDNYYHQLIYAQLDTDKVRRLSEYRRMSAFAEVADCLDEICDECIVKDAEGSVIHINLDRSTKSSEIKNELKKEFQKFIQVYDLERRGWAYFRQFITEGEIFFENITSNNDASLGIVGVLLLPGELINPVYDNIQNNVINNFILQKPVVLQQPYIPGQPQPINNINTLQYQLIPLQGKQVTYIHSGIWNEDQNIRLPFIENCRRAYKQLSLIEDSIVIYRLVRAPERLKFTIDVGNMPAHEAEAYLNQLKQTYWNKKTYDSEKGGAANLYNPQSMLDSFWFTKRSNGESSNVELMQGGANLGEITDLEYFIKKLYRSLKVPSSRLNPDNQFRDGTEILREELSFAKFIIRLQQQFAGGLKDSFITHLKLRNLWDEYRLKEHEFLLEFNVPSNFMAVREQQLFELKLKNFSDLSNNDAISKTFALRHYMDYSDAQILENTGWLRKDAELRWELAQIETGGPKWRENMNEIANAAGQMGPGGGSGGAPAGGSALGADEIPEFGSAPEGQAPPPGNEQPAPEGQTAETQPNPQ